MLPLIKLFVQRRDNLHFSRSPGSRAPSSETRHYYPFREGGILRRFPNPLSSPPVLAAGRMNCPVNKFCGIFAALMLFSDAAGHLHATETGISI